MKILFLSSRVPFPVRDGHTRRTYNILKQLARGNDVHLLALSDSRDDSRPEVQDHFRQFCADFELLQAPPKRVSLPMMARLLRSLISADPYTRWRHYSGEYRKRVEELVSFRRFDLVHCDILPLAYTVEHGCPWPVALTDHDVCYIKALRIGRESRSLSFKVFSALEWRKLRRYEANLFGRMDLGIAVSDTDRAMLRQLCPRANLSVIENGVDTAVFTPGAGPADERTLIWIGGFGYAPNRDAVHFFLDRVYHLIKQEVPEVRFRIVGADPTERIRQYADRDRSIHLEGYVEDPVPVLRQATVFVAPIGSGSGTRLKTLEAMATAKGIVTTTIGCEGIEGVDKKHYLVADDPAAFARSVVYLLKNRVLREYLGANARRLAVASYDWGMIGEKLDRVYRELCGREQSKLPPMAAR